MIGDGRGDSAGDELVASVDSVDQLRPGTIPDSNRPMLAELLREQGGCEGPVGGGGR